MGKDNNEVVENEKIIGRGNRKFITIIGIILFIVVVLCFFYYSINKKIESYSNKIYPGITINGIVVGEKTKEEAKKVLEVKVLEQVKEKTIKIVANEKDVLIEY